MLLPNKHSHPDSTVLAAATVLLRELGKFQAVTYEELKAALARTTREADYLFSPALSLLYLLGLVEYRSKVDVFEYTGA